MINTIIEEYKPSDNDVIYHYCSAETFNKIIFNKTLWLCDVKRMNDSKEILYAQDLFFNMADNLHIPEERIKEIKNIFNTFFNSLITLSACFSESSDILSQWRSYANDATGFCIGFNVKKLLSIFPFCPLKIVYEKKRQETSLKEKLDDILHRVVDKSPYYELFIGELIFIFAQMKHPSFKEEREVRLVHNLELNEDYSISDTNKEKIKKYHDCLKEVKFRTVNNIPVPYVEAVFPYDKGNNPVQEIVIGSKNKSTEFDIKLFLKNSGFDGLDDICIKRFDCSYI